MSCILMVIPIISVLFLLVAEPACALELKIASIAPEGSQWMQEMRKGASTIKERSNGRVILKFYGGGVMGNEKSVLRKIRVGQLHGGVFTGGGLSEIDPNLQLYSLLFTFRSKDEVDYVRARMDQTLLDELERAGYASFGFAGGGFAQLMGNLPVRSIEDLKGRKFWVPEGDAVIYAAVESLGLSPVTLPITDVMTGLQTGLVDIIGSSAIGAIAFQWHARLKFITSTPLAYLYATLVVDRQAFSRLTAEDQAMVREVMGGVYQNFDRQNTSDNQAALEALKKQGLIVVDPLPGEEKRWRDLAAAVNERLGRDGTFSPVLYKRMQDDLQRFRSETAAKKN